MHYDFEDAETHEQVDPARLMFSASDLLKQHHKVFVLHTGAGDLIMRYMPLRVRRIVDAMRAMLYPHYLDWSRSLAEIWRGADNNMNNLPEELKQKSIELTALLMPANRLDLLGVLVWPRVTCDEDADRLYSLLTTDESADLDELMAELSKSVDPADIDGTVLDLADRYHVDYVDRELLDNLTVQQANYLIGRINAENAELMKAMKPKEGPQRSIL
jgi:hypothetical protein